MNLDKGTLKSLLGQGIISKEVFKELTEGKADLTHNREIGDVTLLELLKGYESYLYETFAQNTADGYFANLRHFYEYIYESSFRQIDSSVKFTNITADSVERWLNSLASNGYSLNSLRRFRHSIRCFLEYLSSVCGVNTIDIDSVELPQMDEDKAPIDALTDQEIRGMAEHASSVRNKAMILLMYESSMKRQELINCKKDHIDLDRRLVEIVDTDGNVDRVGQFSEYTKKVLIDHLRDTPREFDHKVESEYLFQTSRSPQVSYGTIVRAIKEASLGYFTAKFVSEGYPKREAEQMGRERSDSINTETLRHSLRAYLFSEGKDIQTIQAIMGDENRHKVRRYLKVSQRLYPEKFFT